jgi:hypothetical protein
MGFEEFFENDRKDNRNNRVNSYKDDNEYPYNSRYPFNGNENNVKWQNILEKIRSNKKLKLFVVSAGILILTTVIVLIIVLFPLIVKLINYITQNGLQGVLDEISGFLDKILKGTAN